MMSNHRWSALLLAISTVTACSGPNTTEADLDAINQLWNRYATAQNTKDSALYASLWVEDSIRMPPNRPTLIGNEAIRLQMQQYFDQGTWELVIANEETKVFGNWAFSRGTYTTSIKTDEGAEAERRSGKYLSILQRQPDGSWRIARDCFNRNDPVQR